MDVLEDCCIVLEEKGALIYFLPLSKLESVCVGFSALLHSMIGKLINSDKLG